MLKFRSRLEGCAAVAALVVMFLCIAVQVFFRYALDNALEWPEEVARYAFICAVFLGASLAADEGRHLEIGISRHLFGPRVAYAVTFISAAFSLLFCGIMAAWGIRMSIFVADSDQVAASMQMPMWVMYLVIPAGMACMALRTLNHTLRALRKLRGKKTDARETLKKLSGSW